MYDPLNRTLFQGSLEALKRKRKQTQSSSNQLSSENNVDHIEIPIKDCKTKVDIRVPLHSPKSLKKGDSDDCGIYLATVDLGRLGRTIKNGVRAGKITNVYVLGYVPDRLMSDSGAESDDE